MERIASHLASLSRKLPLGFLPMRIGALGVQRIFACKKLLDKGEGGVV